MAFGHPLPDLGPQPRTLASLEGIRCSGVAAGIKPSGKPDVALLVADAPLSVAGVFTKNHYAAAPVLVSRAHLERTGGHARAIVVSSGNANACTGARGERDATAMCEAVARLVGCDPAEVLVASTGVIGVPLPLDRVLSGIAAAHGALASGDDAGRGFLHAIMTTDAFPKQASSDVSGASFSVAGCCKGAGMIEPNMATMLAFVGTDAGLEPAELARLVPTLAKQSFNAVHVDTHASTNDTFLLVSTGAHPVGAHRAALETALARVTSRLSWLIARDGEGATKVTTIRITGAHSDAGADAIARALARSALVRTALFGNDPNWGRFVSAAGNSPHLRHPERVRCTLQGVVVFDRGEPAPFDRVAVSTAMRAEDVELALDLGDGDGTAVVMTSDLGYRYVEVNAEYTT